MRIAFVTASWHQDHTLGGVGIYRCLLPAKALRWAGHKVFLCPDLVQSPSTGELGAKGFDGSIEGDLDMIVHVSAMSADLANAIPKARAFGQKIVADCDDWILGTPASNIAFGVLNQEKRGIRFWQRSVSESDAVIYSTPFLAEKMYARQPKRQKSAILRNAIDLSLPWPQREQQARPTYGWTGQCAWRPDDLKRMRGILVPFQEKHNVEFVHVGHRDGDPTFAELTGLSSCQQIEGATYEKYIQLIQFDVGLVPLAPTDFNRAKSWLKRLEYGACSIPSIAQETDEQIAFSPSATPSKPNNWNTILRHSLDRKWRIDLAIEARQSAIENSIAKRGIEWVQFLESI